MTSKPLQIVGLGMATLDVLMRLREMPTWERGTRLSDFGFDGGGPVGTAMVAAAKLGTRVGFVGTVGNDAAAELKMRSFHDVGVDLSRLVARNVPEDQVVIVYVHADTGERVFAGVARPSDTQLQPDELDRAYITSADYLHLDGYHSAAALQAAQWMHEAGKQVVLDGSKTSGPVRGHLRALVEHVDVLISGSGFVQGLTGEADLADALLAALDYGPRIAVQTEGEDGAYTAAEGAGWGGRSLPRPVLRVPGHRYDRRRRCLPRRLHRRAAARLGSASNRDVRFCRVGVEVHPSRRSRRHPEI